MDETRAVIFIFPDTPIAIRTCDPSLRVVRLSWR